MEVKGIWGLTFGHPLLLFRGLRGRCRNVRVIARFVDGLSVTGFRWFRVGWWGEYLQRLVGGTRRGRWRFQSYPRGSAIGAGRAPGRRSPRGGP